MDVLNQQQKLQDQEYTWLLWTDYLLLGDNIKLMIWTK